MRTESPSRLSCVIRLPDNFRVADVLAFHGRDPLALAERVDGDSLQKGLSWGGRPACLTMRFARGQVSVELAVDGATTTDAEGLARRVARMLGLTQGVEEFEQAFHAHPQLGRLIAQRPGLRVALAATPFEALTWAITGQQISLGAAISIRRKLIQACDLRHSGGLGCHPDAKRLAMLSEADLRLAGFSQAKAQTLILLCREVMANRLPLDAWMIGLPVAEIQDRLLRLRGVGPWTVNYALLRGFGWLDGSLHGDVAVRRKLQQLLAAPDRLSEAFVQHWLAEFAPWRALVAAHLWAMTPSPG